MTDIIIGFDAKRIVRNGTGLGSYGRTLVNDLARQQDLQLRLYAPDEGRADLRSQIVERPNVRFSFAGRKGVGAAWWRMSGMVEDLRHDGVQLYHGLTGELPIGIRKSGIRSVVTIHDLIFLRHPEFYHWADTKIYAWKFRQTLKEADHIIAISECTKRDIMELGGIDDKNISVIYQSHAPRFSTEVSQQLQEEVLKHYQLPRRFILSVGSIEARKNILLAVKALPLLPADISLVLVGRHTQYADMVADYAQKQGLSQRVVMVHGVPDQHLPAFYTLAESFVYPSVYEGFGIPIIEAISSGLPVVACTGSCLEEAGGPDCYYVAPDDIEGMATAISHTLRGTDGREERIARSQQYIRRFEGTDVAGQVADLYHRLL
ncbi:MAG: glycosyltransferase family 4 protein [Bacteroidaceae bacterium]|nr:glycosyltransferase family 4 protein [Prevotella sp.]MBR0273796.1 glycosyltransferase family 4 protein [Bacteroidaceae bacterium]